MSAPVFLPRYPMPRSILPMVVAFLLGMAAHLTAQSAPQSAPGEDIRGPKALVEIPEPKHPPLALWAGVGAGVLAVAIAAWLWHRRRRRQRLRTPREVALLALSELEARSGAFTAEAFADRAAQTVRSYIADHFGLAAPRRTTEEFLRELADGKDTRLSGESEALREFLKACDLAKFAASQLDSVQRGELIRTAVDFVTATGQPVAAPKSKAAAP